jgi:hypothetical protein
MFYDWMSFGTYEQTLRVDGFRQQELNISDPSYPNPGRSGAILPISRYVLGDDLTMQRSRRFSAGIDQTVTSQVRFNVTYAYIRGDRAWRGQNLNHPIDGLRPDPAFGNVVQVTADGRSRQHSMTTSFNVNLARPAGPGPGGAGGRDGPTLNGVALAPPPPGFGGGSGGPRWDWRRVTLNGFYTTGRFDNNSDGAFSLPATGLLDEDWGPSPQDVGTPDRRRHLQLAAAKSRCRLESDLEQRDALQHTDRPGRQQRFRVQRSAGRHRP